MSHPPASTEARRAHGKALRSKLHRADQSHCPIARKRDVVKILLDSSRGRLPRLLPIKWGRMVASPFGFYRGAVPVMAADLAASPRTGITVRLCGDAHIRNLGAYAAPDGRLIFDINDFDETIDGPWEWDVKRLATSLILAGREAGDSEALCKQAVHAFASTYRASISRFSRMAVLELARHQVRRELVTNSVGAVLRKAERES